MALNAGAVTIELDALDKGFSSGLGSAEKKLSSFGKLSEGVSKTYSKGWETMQTMGTVALGGIVTGLSGMVAAGVKSQMSMETLGISLETALGGSAEKAKAAEKSIVSFAAKTPYQIGEVTDAFIGLTNMGLNAGERALTSYGNTASAMGKPLAQMTEAVKDAATGEFERLKEFGIKTKKQGDDVSFTFKGITTTVKNNSKEIEGYLIGLGETNFAGGMEKQSQSLAGLWSTLTDTISLGLGSLVKELGVFDLAKTAVSGLITYLGTVDIAGFVGSIKTYFEQFKNSILTLQPYFQPIIDWFVSMNTNGQLVNGILGGLATTLGVGLIGAIGGMVIAALPLILTVTTIVAGFTALWLAFQNPIIQTFLTGTWALLVSSFQFFQTSILPIAIQKVTEFGNTIFSLSDKVGIVSALGGDFTKILQSVDLAKTSLVNFYNEALLTVTSYIQSNFAPELNTLQTIWTSLNTVIQQAITWFTPLLSLIPLVGGVLLFLASNVLVALQSAWQVLREPINQVITALADFVGTISQVVIPIISVVTGVLVVFGGFLATVLMPVFQVLGAFVAQIFKGILEVITGFVNVVTGVLKVLIGTISGIFTGDFAQVAEGFKQIWNGLGTFLGGMLNVIISPVKAIVIGIENTFKSVDLFQAGVRILQSLADGFSSMIGNVKSTIQNGINSAISSIKIPNLPAPKIPGFAKGVNNFGGGLAMVGELGPELVNLPKGSDVITANKTKNMLSNLPNVSNLLNSPSQNTTTTNKSVNIDNVNITDNSAVNSFFNTLNRAIA